MNHKLRIYLTITFILSWGIAGIWWFFTDEPDINSVSYIMMATAFMFMSMLAAIIVQKWIYKSKVKEPFVNCTICLIWPETRHLSLSALEIEDS